MENRADELYDLIRHHSGYGHRHIPDDVLKAFIDYEWQSGRWAATRNIETDEITGWISWYNLNADSLEQVKEMGLPGCYQQHIPLTPGLHCYIANVVVKEEQPNITFRLLWNLACQRNPEANTFNAHFCNRPDVDGKHNWRWISHSQRHFLQEA